MALGIYLRKCIDHYYGLSITEFKEVAYQYAVNAKIEFPQSWVDAQMAGRQWYYGYMMRHKQFSLRTPEQTSLNRVKAFCRENVDAFFRNLNEVVHSFSESSIWNMDETGFSTVPTKMGKIISLKGIKRVGKITSAERGSMMTLAFAVSASGNKIPAFYLIPRKNMSTTFRTFVTREVVTIANESGWMTQKEFLLWIDHFIKYSGASKSNPQLLLLDNHGSHLSVDAIDRAVEHGVTMLTFPPHCSHRLQPLDVTVYGPVKGAYATAHDTWMKQNAGNAMQIMHIPLIVGTALDRGATTANIKSGFRCTGICPFDSGIFQDSDFISTEVAQGNKRYIFVESEFNEEEQRRIVYLGDDLELDATETVSTTSESTPNTSHASGSANTSRAGSEARAASEARIDAYVSMLDTIGPVQKGVTKPKSNRGPKPGKTTILTSPENMASLKEKQLKRKSAAEKKEANKEAKKQKDAQKKMKPAKPSTLQTPTTTKKSSKAKSSTSKPSPAKKSATKCKKKRTSSSSDEDEPECCICSEPFNGKPTARNSYVCMGLNCNKLACHKCAVLKYHVWTCIDCDSDDDL